jgi:hypothetical protein
VAEHFPSISQLSAMQQEQDDRVPFEMWQSTSHSYLFLTFSSAMLLLVVLVSLPCSIAFFLVLDV